MSTLLRLNNKIKTVIWEWKHKAVRKSYRARFKGNIPSIICCNCIGGILYHELGIQFKSPTVNLYMNCEDFIKFCENMKYYLSLEIKQYEGKIERDYPMGQLGDLILYFVHYSSFDEARKKWNQRKYRIDWDNIFIIATDRDGFNMDLLKRFLKLPYKNKKIFTHLPYINKEDIIYLKGFETEAQIEGLMYKTARGCYLIDQFDWVSWFNKGK